MKVLATTYQIEVTIDEMQTISDSLTSYIMHLNSKQERTAERAEALRLRDQIDATWATE